MRGGAGHGESMCGAKVTFQVRAFGGNYMIRPRRWLSATESRSSTCSPGESSCCCSWHPIVTPCAFQQPAARARGDIGCRESHCNGSEGSGGDQQPTLWRSNGNCTASVTADGTQKRYDNESAIL